MAKIPRIQQGDRPSAVVGGAPRVDTEAADVAGALGKLAGTGYEITADMEAREAKRRDDAIASMQAIVDETAATRKIADFNMGSFGSMSQLQEKFQDDPAKAIQAFVEDARQRQDELRKTAANDKEGLHIVRGTAADIASDTNNMFRWSLTQMAQNAKGNVEVTANQSAAEGAQASNVGDLSAHLFRQKEKLGPLLEKTLGAKAGADRLQRLQSETAFENFSRRSVVDPWGVQDELDDTKGVAAKFFDSGQRETLRRKAEQAAEGLPIARQRAALRAGITKTTQISEQIIRGEMTPVDMDREVKRATLKREVIELDKSILPKDKPAELAIVDQELAYLNAADSWLRRQSGYVVEGKSEIIGKLNADQKALFKGTGADIALVGDKNLADVLKQQTAVEQAVMGGAITQAQANVYRKQFSLAMPKAYKQAKGDTWHWGLDYQNESEVGHASLNKEFKYSYPKATAEQQNDAFLKFTSAMTEREKLGQTVTDADAHRIALESVARAMKQDPMGLFTGKGKK